MKTKPGAFGQNLHTTANMNSSKVGHFCSSNKLFTLLVQNELKTYILFLHLTQSKMNISLFIIVILVCFFLVLLLLIVCYLAYSSFFFFFCKTALL